MPSSRLFFLAVLILCVYSGLHSQNTAPFRYQYQGAPLELQELERQFNAWKDTTDLSQVKGWKYMQRWLAEQRLHTDGSGNPGDASSFIQYRSNASQLRQMDASQFNAAWYPVGPSAIPENLTGYLEAGIGRINCMAFHPENPNILYVGVAQGGVWKSENNGQSWYPLTDNLPILRISDIEINPQNPNEIYLAVGDYAYLGISLELNQRKRHTHYGIGVYKSTDGGITWNPTGLGFSQTDRDASLVCEVMVHPQQPQTVLAATYTGMYRSTDAGNTWTPVLDSLMWDLVADPQNPEVVYATTGWVASSNVGTASIMKSVDFGQTWTVLNTGIPPQQEVQRLKLAISPQNTAVLYAAAVDAYQGYYGMYRSTNAGATWTFIPAPINVLDGNQGEGSGGQGTYDLALLVDPQNANRIFIGGVNLYASDDAGQSFNPVAHWTTYYGPTIHADQHYLYHHPATDAIYAVNDGGIYRTNQIVSQTWDDANAGNWWPTQWENLGNGMNVTSFYRLSSSKNTLGRLIAGAQDNSTSYFDGQNWYSVFGGDGMDNYLSPDDDFLLIGSSQFGNFYQSYDGGQSPFGMQTNPNQETAEWTTPIEAAPSVSGRLYVGNVNVVRSEDYGAFWEACTPFTAGTGEPITALAVAPGNGDVLYTASKVNYVMGNPVEIFRTGNGGQSWQNRTSNLPDSLYVTAMAVSPTNADHVYVCFAGFVDGLKVFRSLDGGLNWENISYNLPNAPWNMIQCLPQSENLLLAGDAGVFLLPTNASTWQDQSAGLPNVIVSDIEVNEALNTVYVSTFGRGIWATDLDVLTRTNELTSQPNSNYVIYKAGPQQFTVQRWDNSNMPATVHVINIEGKTMANVQMVGMDVTFPTHDWASGLYFVCVRDKAGLQVLKVQVHHP